MYIYRIMIRTESIKPDRKSEIRIQVTSDTKMVHYIILKLFSRKIKTLLKERISNSGPRPCRQDETAKVCEDTWSGQQIEDRQNDN